MHESCIKLNDFYHTYSNVLIIIPNFEEINVKPIKIQTVKISSYLKELLYTHDCVIIPNFGAFKTKYKSAEIDSQKKVIKPPEKEVYFDNKLLTGDGLLVNYIAEKENITKSEAQEIVFKDVTNAFVKLEQGSKIFVEGIGNFTFDKKRKPQFQADTSVNFLTDSYGLPQIKLLAKDSVLERKATQPEKNDDLEKKETQQTQQKRKTRTTKKEVKKKQKRKSSAIYFIIASIAVALLLMLYFAYQTGYLNKPEYVASLLRKQKSTSTQIAKLETQENNNETSADKTEIPSEEVSSSDDDFLLPTDETKIETPKKDETTKDEDVVYVEPKVKADSKKTFYLIAGSYADFDSANKVSQEYQNKGYNSEVMEKENGVYRVTLGGYKYKSTALKELEKVRKNENKNVWLLSK